MSFDGRNPGNRFNEPISMRILYQGFPGLAQTLKHTVPLSRKGTVLFCYQKVLASTATITKEMGGSIPENMVRDNHSQTQHEQEQGQGQTRPDYSTWNTPSLIARISELERQLHYQTVELAASSSIRPSSSSMEAIARTPLHSSIHPPAAASDPQEEPRDQFPKVPEKTSPSAQTQEDITHTRAPGRPAKQLREIDPSKYHSRFIALKFAYLGQRYNGFEHTNGNVTPLPTIEEELWKAFRKTRLILPPAAGFSESSPNPMKPYSINWEGCQYSKAGRTDRGVSAFGQVIGIRVRSARPKVQKGNASVELEDRSLGEKDLQISAMQSEDRMDLDESSANSNWDDVADELPYVHMLNRVLPEDIKMLAWCPHPPADFDARFSCRERRYKYFFTQPAFAPTPGLPGFTLNPKDAKYREGWLDIDAMRKAAKCFEGVHDFRNFCKIDTSKQIENFERIIYFADIELVDPKVNMPSYVGQLGFRPSEDSTSDAESTAQVYSFTLYGSAFLWHQVRHMVGLLFLVGQGLESPSIVPDLLDISKNPGKPTYEMASDAPLVLWDTKFPDEKSGSREDALEWIDAGDPRMSKSRSVKGGGKFGSGGVVDDLWTVWRQRKMDEILAASLLDLTVSQSDQNSIDQGDSQVANPKKPSRGQKIFYGGNEAKLGGKYVQVMQKRKMEPVEVLNARWLANKQRKRDEAPGA